MTDTTTTTTVPSSNISIREGTSRSHLLDANDRIEALADSGANPALIAILDSLAKAVGALSPP